MRRGRYLSGLTHNTVTFAVIYKLLSAVRVGLGHSLLARALTTSHSLTLLSFAVNWIYLHNKMINETLLLR